MKVFYLRTKGGESSVDYYWAGNGWWTRRKDQAVRFTSREDAEAEMRTAVTVESWSLQEAHHAQ